MPSVYLHNRNVVEAMSQSVSRGEDSGVFKTNWALSIFTAMLGAAENRVEESGGGERDAEIPDRFFYNNNKEGVAYLLTAFKDDGVENLKESSEGYIWQVFESYANGGLEIMEEWMIENPASSDLSELLLRKILEYAYTLVDDPSSPRDLDDIQF